MVLRLGGAGMNARKGSIMGQPQDLQKAGAKLLIQYDLRRY
jgi:hypothetical protein